MNSGVEHCEGPVAPNVRTVTSGCHVQALSVCETGGVIAPVVASTTEPFLIAIVYVGGVPLVVYLPLIRQRIIFPADKTPASQLTEPLTVVISVVSVVFTTEAV